MSREEKFLKIFQNVIETVFTTLTGLPARYLKTETKADHLSEKEFTGIMDFFGNAKGTCAICMPEALLRKISAALTEFENKDIADEVLADTVGEIVNQISGLAKAKLDKTPYGFQMSTPRKLIRKRQSFTERTDLPCIALRFEIEKQEMVFLLSIISADGVPLESSEEPEAAVSAAPFVAAEEPLEIAGDMKEIVDSFIVESEETLEKLDQDLVELDRKPDDKPLIDQVFRAYHSLKGNSGALGFTDMQTMVHRTEDVIRKVRDNELNITPDLMDVVLKATDQVKTLLGDIKDKKKRLRNLTPIINRLKEVLEGKAAPVPVPDQVEEKLHIEEDMKEIVAGFIVETEEMLTQLDQDLVSIESAPEDMELLNKIFRAFHTLKGNSGALGFLKLQTLDHHTEDIIRKVRDGKMKLTPPAMDVVLRSVDIIKGLIADIKRGKVSKTDLTDIEAELALALEEKYDELKARRASKTSAPGPASGAPQAAPEKKEASATIRVDTAKLDKLIDVTGELTLTRNRLLGLMQQLEQGSAVDNLEEVLNELNAQLGLQVSGLQNSVMSSRMQPIGKVFSKYTRVVRDLARDAGKEIDLVITGQDTELDNTIVEEIGDPLIHMVRNSCDHGIETPEARKATGKPSKGRLDLKAYQEGSFVYIEVKDDGKGLNPEVIKKKALEKGLISAERALRMTKGELLNLIFLPGFSTAEKVTAVSGRGVGMDVVNNSIMKLSGVVELDSEVGKGTTIKIRLPLTLAVMLGLEVEVGEEKYLIPQEALVEIVPLTKEQCREVRATNKFLFRNRFLNPVVDLKKALCCNSAGRSRLPAGERGCNEAGQGYIVVVGEVEKRTGILVDNVLRQHEVVIKPLGKYVSRFSPPAVSGATLMGDGSIELILNARHLMSLGQETKAE